MLLLLLNLTASGDDTVDAKPLIAETQRTLAETGAQMVALSEEAAAASVEAMACVDQHQARVDALAAVAAKSLLTWKDAVDVGDTERATHELRKLAVIHQKTRQFAVEADTCLRPSTGGCHYPLYEPPEPDPTDEPAYYALDDEGWVLGWSGRDP